MPPRFMFFATLNSFAVCKRMQNVVLINMKNDAVISKNNNNKNNNNNECFDQHYYN